MADNQYPCPDCSAVLRPPRPVNPGQKVKCPKCQKVFVPVPKKADEDDEGGTFGMAEDTAEEKAREAEVKKQSVSPLKDKRPKSARGPAIALCTPPGNRLLATASFTCASCLLSILVLLWPMLFKTTPKPPDPNEPALAPPEKPKATVVEKPENKALRWLDVGLCVLAFVYNGLIVLGAVKMMSLESYSWGMSSGVLMAIPLQYAFGSYAGFNWIYRLSESMQVDFLFYAVALFLSAWYLFVGYSAIKMLRDPKVLAGFAEAKPEDV